MVARFGSGEFSCADHRARTPREPENMLTRGGRSSSFFMSFFDSNKKDGVTLLKGEQER